MIFDFPSERSVVTRERASATYRTSTYYVSKMLTEMPRSIFFSLLSTLVVYWSIGFKNEFPAFLRFFLVVVGIAQFGEALAIAISIATGNAQTSAALAPVCVIVSVLFAGFFTETNQIPVWVRWIKWISFVFYAFNAFAKVEFPGRPFGQEILDQAGFNSLSYWENMAGLFGLIVALRLVGYLSLKYLKGPKFLKF